MKWFCLLILSGVLAACSSGSDSAPAAPPVGCATASQCALKPFSGPVANLNGSWQGTGSVEVQNHKIENLNFLVVFSKLPDGLDITVTVKDQKGSLLYYTTLTGHSIENNKVTDIRDFADVGRVGQEGFYLRRQENFISGILNSSGSLVMQAETLSYGNTMKFNANVSKVP